MEKHFTHLHLHTEFSLLDGAIGLDKLIDYGKKNNLKAMAMTDHGNIFGAVKFFQKCKSAGIKPVLGIEAYLTEDVAIKSVEKKYYHMILLVQNSIGYKNLCKLISFSYQEGFYFKPRIDYNALKKYSEGLIATTACLGGHIPTLIINNNEKELDKYINWYLDIFGPERFYFEVQPEHISDQKILNKKLFELGKKYGISCVATGDCHYVNQSDHEAHEIMLAIQTHAKMDDPDRFSFGDYRAYMRSVDEMLQIFKDNEEAVWNSGKIADMCDFSFETGKLFFPKFEIPNDHTQESYFKFICQRGFDKLLQHHRIEFNVHGSTGSPRTVNASYVSPDTLDSPSVRPDPSASSGLKAACPPKLFSEGWVEGSKTEIIKQYQARLDLEINLIIKMGYIGYFLVVSDFIQWAKLNGIPVGPGRGSAAGSLVAWALEITNIDPIKYNLLFERFLNPERVSMPDIDIDFCIEGREKVIQYVRDKYGHDKVCQIITFGTMMAKGVIKDVARVLGFPFEDANSLTELIPEQLKISLNESVEQEPKLKNLIETNPKVAHLFDIAQRLEGLTRHASKHAAGIVISPEPIDDVLPVYVPPKTTELVTQYAMTELENLGFLKMDLLGLKNLTLIDRAVQQIEKNHKIKIDIDKIPLDDSKTFDLIKKGKTSGVFQLESHGLKEVLCRLQPEKFEDIIAVNALYRPGPLGSGMVDDFIERRHGRQKIEYLFAELEPVLQETYGVIVYQEQVMKIASVIAGYTLGESDILRRAMGKKKPEEMAKQSKIFVEKAENKGFSKQKAQELFDLMAYFAGYGFNKSHSAAYALIAYQTAFLKANFPAEFMACLISLESTNTENMAFYLEEAKELNLNILPPDINKSEINFTVIDNQILFGLMGIKNVGLAALENIILERNKKKFDDLLDFCSRIDLRTSNKRVIENLICAGAFDKLPGYRAQKHNELPKIIEIALEKKKAALTGQMDLFGKKIESVSTEKIDYYTYQQSNEWTDKEKLDKEKDVIGFYLSSHPLDTFKIFKLINFNSFDKYLEKIKNAAPEQEIIAVGCGIKKSHRTILTKNGDSMAFVQLEDKNSTAEIIIFPKLYSKIEQWLNTHNAFIVKGAMDITSTTKCKIKANHFVPIDLFFESSIFIETMNVDFQNMSIENINVINNLLKKGKTKLNFLFNENGKMLRLKSNKNIYLDQEVLNTLQEKNISIKLEI